MDIEYILKICTIGDESTGKTSIIKKFINDDFNNDYNPTVGVDINSIKMKINDKNIKLYIHDISGDEKFTFLTKTFCVGVSACIIVFDLNNLTSRNNLDYWIKFVKNINNTSLIIIFGNKKDLIYTTNNDDVFNITSNHLLNNDNCFYIEASAKTGENIYNGFYILVKLLINININPFLYELNIKYNKEDVFDEIVVFNKKHFGTKINIQNKLNYRSCLIII